MRRLIALPIIALGLVFNTTVTHTTPAVIAADPQIVDLGNGPPATWHSQRYKMVAVPAPKPKPKPKPKPRPTHTATVTTSRSEVRTPVRHNTPTVTSHTGSPKAYAESLVGSAQFSCLDRLWERESGWNSHASNSSSGAYGIPQALPGSKMASAGSDWRTNPDTQVRWGIRYIESRYGSPCAAWAHSQANGWY